MRREAGLTVTLADDADDVVMASLPMQGTTAYLSLKELARIQPGDSVLVQGAAGGVGSLAVLVVFCTHLTMTFIEAAHPHQPGGLKPAITRRVDALPVTHDHTHREYEGVVRIPLVNVVVTTSSGTSITPETGELRFGVPPVRSQEATR